jgi:N4-gp56 family major capsid protein
MALETTSSAGLSGQYQKYFKKPLLDHAVQKLVLSQYGQKTPFPKNTGSKQIRWTRTDAALASNVQTSTEGVAIATFRDSTLTFVDATLVRYDIAAKVSDVLNFTDLFRSLEIAIKSMGEDVALHADTQIRNELVAAITGAGNKRYVGTTQTWAGLAALTAAQGAITITDILDAMTRLQITRAPELNGRYIMVCPPQVCRDILNDPKVVLAGQYGTSKNIMNGEVGEWYGIKIVMATNPFIEDAADAGTEGTYDATLAAAADGIYVSFALGSDGFGIPQMAGLSPFSPSVMICDKADKTDPSNAFITAAMRFYWVVKTLNDQWVVALRSKSAYAG